MSDRIDVATRKGLFTIERHRDGWAIGATHFLGDNCSMVLHDERDGAHYCALDHGHFGTKLQRSLDDGRTWEEVGVPVYPEPPDDAEPTPPPMGKPIPWSLKLIWELRPGGPEQDGVLWCGTAPGGLFHSRDRGTSWEMVRSLWDRPERASWFGGGFDWPGIHSISVDPRNADRLVLAISCGGVWATEDAGTTWTLLGDGLRAEYMPAERASDPTIQDPHLIARCTSVPDTMWIQHHNGIFCSNDEARTWNEIREAGPSTFGFAVAAHPVDPRIAWFVPAVKDEHRIPVDGRFVVTRTRDGGATFDELTDGLPQTHAYDIVFRHALDVDVTGDRLVMGTTTGALYVTENGGDTWTSVTEHLPPIYATRFRKS